MNIGKIKGAMAEQGVTRELLASELSVSVGTISRKLNGKSQFTVDEAVKLTEYLKIEDPLSVFF